MKLKGSCHCGKITFSVKSKNYYPYQRCYCSICRKVQGGGGYAINLSAEADSLKVSGKKHLKVYKVKGSTSQRNFCKHCASMLWLFDPTWPDLVHPFASALDSRLPRAPQSTHLMLDFKAPWVVVQKGTRDKFFKRYPKESIAQFHERHKKLK